MSRKPTRRPVPPATDLRNRAGSLARRVRRRLRRVGVLLGQLAEEAAIRLTGTTAAFTSTAPSPHADTASGSAGASADAMANSPRPPASTEPPEPAPQASPTAQPAPESPTSLAEATITSAAPAEMGIASGPPAPDPGSADSTPDGPEAAASDGNGPPERPATPSPSPFPLQERLHTWLYTARAPSALQILPIEPRRAWCWWRLDQADRERVDGRHLVLEIIDGAGIALQRHRVDAAQGEYFVDLAQWRPRVGARLLAHRPDGDTIEVLRAAAALLPPESPGDQAIRWTLSVHRGDHVRGLPAEREHPDLPEILTARLMGRRDGAVAGAVGGSDAAGTPDGGAPGGLPSSLERPAGALGGSHALPVGSHSRPHAGADTTGDTR